MRSLSFLFYIFTKTPTKDLERSFSQWADELRLPAADPVKENAVIADRSEEHGGQVAGGPMPSNASRCIRCSNTARYLLAG